MVLLCLQYHNHHTHYNYGLQVKVPVNNLSHRKARERRKAPPNLQMLFHLIQRGSGLLEAMEKFQDGTKMFAQDVLYLE